jgi:hypothetical protein
MVLHGGFFEKSERTGLLSSGASRIGIFSRLSMSQIPPPVLDLAVQEKVPDFINCSLLNNVTTEYLIPILG